MGSDPITEIGNAVGKFCLLKIKKIDKDKDVKNDKKDKVKEYIIGNVTVEIVDGIVIKVNGVEAIVRGLEDKILNNIT